MTLYEHPDLMKNQIDKFFAEVKESAGFYVGEIFYEQPYPTISGLALYLRFSSRAAFLAYAEKPEFAPIVEYGLLRMETRYETLLQQGVANAKLGLKQVGGWDTDDKAITVNNNIAQVSRTTIEERLQYIRSLTNKLAEERNNADKHDGTDDK